MTRPDSTPDQSVVWTMKVVGGEPFEVIPKDGPALIHNGILSVWNISLRKSQVERLEQIALHHGARVPLLHAETDRTGGGTRSMQLEIQKEEYHFPTPRCPGCFWFDPLSSSRCGYVDWPDEMKKEVMSKAWDDLNQCPKRASASS